MQAPSVEQDLHALLPNNPFIPPKGDVCFINNLPPELLSHIFEVGVVDTDSEDEDEADVYWENLRSSLEEDDDTAEESEHGSSEGDDEETDDDDDSDATESSDIIPWPPFQIVVSHVCRHWRDVALSTPPLWTTIDVAPESRRPYLPVSAFLERSKGLPIDIYIDCEPPEADHPIEAMGPSFSDLEFLYNLLTPHIHRWRTIEVSVSRYRDMFLFLHNASLSFITAAPQLTALRLYHHCEMEESDRFLHPGILSRHFTLFNGSAPSLTSIVLWGVHVDWDLPWITSASRLVDLELAFHTEDVRPTWEQFATILRGASFLEKLSLRMSGPSGDPSKWIIEPTPGSSDLNAPILLPKVSDFVLAFHSQTRAIGLIRKLVLPAIKNLVLDFDDGDYTDLVKVLVGPPTFLSPPLAKEKPGSLLSRLESLKLAGLPCHHDSIDILYGELQNLTSLNISLSFLHSRFLDILGTSCTLAGRGDVWLPRLKTLYVSGTSGDVIREVVTKRRSAGVPLESLYVEESCELEGGDMDWLKQNLKTFELFEGSDDEDEVDFEDLHESEEVDEWSDIED